MESFQIQRVLKHTSFSEINSIQNENDSRLLCLIVSTSTLYNHIDAAMTSAFHRFCNLYIGKL